MAEVTETALPPAFTRHVLAWLKRRVPDAAAIVRVDGQGDDWHGSTEAGFDEKFRVEIGYSTSDGEQRSRGVDGKELADLWRWVVSGFDAPTSDGVVASPFTDQWPIR